MMPDNPVISIFCRLMPDKTSSMKILIQVVSVRCGFSSYTTSVPAYVGGYTAPVIRKHDELTFSIIAVVGFVFSREKVSSKHLKGSGPSNY